MSSTDYRVELDVFNGPLDLLLFLVRRNEVGILDLPIACITMQFLEYLEVLELIDLDLAGDFIVLASSLVEIKSRILLPRPEEEEQEEQHSEDPRSELIHQLLEYKRYKEASHSLERQAAEWQERYPRLSDERPRHGRNPSADRIKQVELWDLVSALSRVLRRTEVERQRSIRYDETPISVYVETISRRVLREGRVAFTSFFDGSRRRSKIIGMFLAILELLRRHGYRAQQSEEYGEIWILSPESQSGNSVDETDVAVPSNEEAPDADAAPDAENTGEQQPSDEPADDAA